MSKFLIRNILLLTAFLAVSILSQKCSSDNQTKSDISYLKFDYWRAVAVLSRSTQDNGDFNIFAGLDKVMGCLTAEIYSWYDVGIIIELNCMMKKFQKSDCPSVFVSYSGSNKKPNTKITPSAVVP